MFPCTLVLVSVLRRSVPCVLEFCCGCGNQLEVPGRGIEKVFLFVSVLGGVVRLDLLSVSVFCHDVCQSLV